MSDRDLRVTLVRAEEPDQVQLPHEQLDVYDVLEEAYCIAMSRKGVSWAKGTTGDQRRAMRMLALRDPTRLLLRDGTANDEGTRVSRGCAPDQEDMLRSTRTGVKHD